MGRGIVGVIPIAFEVDRWDKDRLDDSFLECYQYDEEHNEYRIKIDFLVGNFKDFFMAFHETIHATWNEESFDWNNEFWEAFDLRMADGYDEAAFFELFEENRTGIVPMYNTNHPRLGSPLTVMYVGVKRFIMFYNGSYKAWLEEYTTFTHMERMTAKAIKNPLVKAVKYGIHG